MQSSTKFRFILTAALAFAPFLRAQAPQHAQVTYANGELTVAANNSSLNQILRDIAHETGMKITGGVTDERVFGQYGPATPSKILGELLDGTESNMLLLQATAGAPAELILTPRHGGPTPPSPEGYQEAPLPEPVRPQYPIANQPEENAAPTPTAAAPAQEAPNGVKTPQQIYEQLERMRQQQQQRQSNPQ
ncbi:hypothetical protein P8936_05170 [Edaphobacter paludis]|uniref:Secretin/TonB short N-terminal domain-containing protein n=1 Tax=Edaphobacter paludis TaxID=3035702 RepID=A0AAU7DBT4_9BACT